MMQYMHNLSSRVDACVSPVSVAPQTAASAAPPVLACTGHVAAGIQLSLPPRYEGDPKSCSGFLNLCSIQFELHGSKFPTDRAKIAFIISLLSGEALAWANPIWERHGPETLDLQTFLATFRMVFEEPGRVTSSASAMLRLRQGTLTVGQYAIRFRTLAAELAWNEEAQVAVFWEGLSDRIKDELAGRDRPSSLDGLVSLASRIDMRFRERTREISGIRRLPRLAPAFQRPLKVTPAVPAEEPMQVDRLRLTDLERQRRHSEGLCLY